MELVIIVIVVVLAMMGEVLEKPELKNAARWVFAGVIILLIYKLLL